VLVDAVASRPAAAAMCAGVFVCARTWQQAQTCSCLFGCMARDPPPCGNQTLLQPQQLGILQHTEPRCPHLC
jgi:hypothetical protein